PNHFPIANPLPAALSNFNASLLETLRRHSFMSSPFSMRHYPVRPHTVNKLFPRFLLFALCSKSAHALDVSPNGPQFLNDSFISAVDKIHPVTQRLAARLQSRQH